MRPTIWTVLASCGSTLLVLGCSVGWQYSYRGKQYSMTQASIDYHRAAIADVQRRHGDPRLQEDPDQLRQACTLLQKYAAESPEPGAFTPARELLDAEASVACGRSKKAAELGQDMASKREASEAREARDRDVREREAEERRIASKRMLIRSALERCSTAWSGLGCEAGELSEEERLGCRKECKEAISAAGKKVTAAALQVCTDAFVREKGATPTACKVEYAGFGPDDNELKQLASECTAACQKDAPKALAEAGRKAASDRKAEAREAAEAANTRRQCIASCGQERAECSRSCAGLSASFRSCQYDCRGAHVRCEGGC
jgi:hypothetical protein